MNNNNYIDYLVHAHTYDFNLSSIKTVFNKNGYQLLKGNENVQAIIEISDFKKEDNDFKNNCDEVISYLLDHFSRNPVYRYHLLRTIKYKVRYLFAMVYYNILRTRPDLNLFKNVK